MTDRSDVTKPIPEADPPPSDDPLLRLAESLADGEEIDWDRWKTVESGMSSLDALRLVGRFAAAMRGDPAEVSSADATEGRGVGSGAIPGQVLGRFEIESEAGRGGMGVVYRARDLVLDRSVALKTLPPELVHSPRRLERFTREAKLLASLNHPNIATIYGMETSTAGIRFLVLEWVDGETLAARLQRGPMPWREALELGRQVAAGLAAAHEGKVIHLDLKPANVMLSSRGAVKVLDFGIARSADPTNESMDPSDAGLAGTWGYVSPERLLRQADHRADVFAFGCVLYECLAGVPAFAGSTPASIQASIVDGTVDWDRLPSGLPSAVTELIERCIQREPEARPSSMSEVGSTLRKALDQSGETRAATSTLPVVATTFWGREAERARCSELLQIPGLVVLVGTGGSGKTRLAIEVARGWEEQRSGPATFVDLSSALDGARVETSLASALGLHDAPGETRLWIQDHLTAMRMLLVLDNCEHLTAAVRDLAQSLLEGCPELRILVTSREALGAGETIYLDPLPVPEEGGTDRELADNVCVRLFLDRARNARTLQSDPETLRAIAEICRRVEGLPLAVELAASRTRVLTPKEIAGKLDRQLQLLRIGEESDTDRHRALRAAIGWSARLLDDRESQFFRSVSVFARGFDLLAATRVAIEGIDEFEALDLIARLAAKSLVTVESVRGESRYRLLEPIRQFAYEQLEFSGDLRPVRERHARYFLELAETAAPLLLGPQQAVWLE
ncbi:MAG: protein kinase, partial [Candidatus Eisenbacteria bacterium]|nr:protein kinase [Candidatus Eisenbacteria bacterium]